MISLIAAVGIRGQLGLNGKLPWHNSEDLKWFKRLTLGGIVVVGYNTYQTLPTLLGRSVVNMGRKTPQDILDEFDITATTGADLWIAGGAKTYEQWFSYIDRYYISRIQYDGEADVWMPTLPFCAR